MGDALNAALAQQQAEDVTREVVPPLVHSEVESQIRKVVEGQLVPVVREELPTIAEALYRANPPAKGEPGLSIKGDPGEPGAKGDSVVGPQGDPGVDGQSIDWRGPWTKGTYRPLDAVELDGSSYIATAVTRTKPPGAGWDLMAQKGRDGGMAGGRQYNVRGFASGMVVDDEGTRLNSGGVIGEIDFAGAGVTATLSGSKALITIPGGGGGSSLTIKDEGVVLDTAVSSIDIVGAGATATNVGHAVTLTVPGASTPNLDAVLTVGNDGGALGMVNVGTIASLPDGGGATAASLTFLDAIPTDGGQFFGSGGNSPLGNIGATFTTGPGSDDGENGGNFYLQGGNGVAGNEGGYVNLIAGNGNGGAGGAFLTVQGAGADGTLGRIVFSTDGSTGSAGQLLTAQGDTTALWGSVIAALIASGHQAAFVEPTTATPEAIANSLIACGLMAAA